MSSDQEGLSGQDRGATIKTLAGLIVAALVAGVVTIKYNAANSAGAATTFAQTRAIPVVNTASHETGAFALDTRVDGGALTEALRATPNGGLAVGTTTDPGATNLQVAGISYLAGGMRLKTRVLTSGDDPFTATTAENVLFVSDTAANRTVNLPCASAAGTVFFVIDTSNLTTHTITIAAVSGAIHGPPNAGTISIAYDLRAFVTDGTNCSEL